MKGSDFVFDSVQLLSYKCHRINFRRGGSYNDSPDWVRRDKSNNKSEKQRWQMFSVCGNFCIKLWRN